MSALVKTSVFPRPKHHNPILQTQTPDRWHAMSFGLGSMQNAIRPYYPACRQNRQKYTPNPVHSQINSVKDYLSKAIKVSISLLYRYFNNSKRIRRKGILNDFTFIIHLLCLWLYSQRFFEAIYHIQIGICQCNLGCIPLDFFLGIQL